MNIDNYTRNNLMLLRQARKLKTCYASTIGNCEGKISSAHSISKSKVLGTIAENGKVVEISADGFNQTIDYNEISIKNASVFFGFCGYHDSTIFSDIDNSPESINNVALIQFHARSSALELHKKESKVLGFKEILEHQTNQNYDYSLLESNLVFTEQGVKDLRHEVNSTFKMLSENARINYAILDFVRFSIPMVATSPFIVDVDYNGNSIFNFGYFTRHPPIVCVTMLRINSMQRCILTWRDEHANECMKWINSYIGAGGLIGNKIFSLLLHFCENLYFSPVWFKKATHKDKQIILDGFSQWMLFNQCSVRDLQTRMKLPNLASYPRITTSL